MQKLAFLISTIFLLSLCSVQGQLSGAAVSMNCNENSTNETYPNSSNVSVVCVVSNPTAYVEKIHISVNNTSIHTNFSSTIYVGAGADELVYVNVSLKELITSPFQLHIKAMVEELNNLPPPNSATSEQNVTFSIVQTCSSSLSPTLGNVLELMFFDSSTNVTHSVILVLNETAAPVHVQNFLTLAELGCYDNTTMHRVIDDFMIQGGDFTNADGTGGHAGIWAGFCNGQESNNSSCGGQGVNAWTIPDEANNSLSHTTCTISMAKTSQANTGGSQFFLIPEDTQQGQGATWLDGVHTVFGSIEYGCGAVTTLSEVSTGQNDRPVNDVILIEILDGDHDDDGVFNPVDAFPNNASEWTDSDGDGVGDNTDAYPFDANETVLNDDDNDGVPNASDLCPGTLLNSTVNAQGCAANQIDSDSDGVSDAFDQCSNTTVGSVVDQTGCEVTESSEDEEAVPGFTLFTTVIAFIVGFIYTRKYDE